LRPEWRVRETEDETEEEGRGGHELEVCLSITYTFAIDINSLIDGPIDDVQIAVLGSLEEVSLANTHD
jgi:hypothetical protein